jgi:hypothetical protein
LWSTPHLKTTEGDAKLEQAFSYGVFLLSPKVTVVTDGAGAPVAEAGLEEEIVLEGTWFGKKAPAVWLEYVSKGAVKAKKLKVLKPYSFADAKGKDAASCMETTTGVSRITVQMPSKWPKDWDHGVAHNLVLDNGIGVDTVAFGTTAP